MPFNINEAHDSGSGSLGRNGEDVITCNVWWDTSDGSTIDASADNLAAVLSFALPHFGVLNSVGKVFSDFKYDRESYGRWKVHAIYKSPEFDRATDSASFSFTIGGGSVHLTQSIKTVASAVQKTNTKPAPNFRGAINQEGIGPTKRVAGLDIDAPKFDFKTTFYIHPNDMTTAFVGELKAAQTCVNSDLVTIRIDGIQSTFNPGELRLLGGEGAKRSGFGDWELSLGWSFNANERGKVIGLGESWEFKPIDKDGWDYLWIWYGPDIDDASHTSVQVPQAAYVEQVYPRYPMSGLLPVNIFGLSNRMPWSTPQIFGTGGFNQIPIPQI